MPGEANVDLPRRAEQPNRNHQTKATRVGVWLAIASLVVSALSLAVSFAALSFSQSRGSASLVGYAAQQWSGTTSGEYRADVGGGITTSPPYAWCVQRLRLSNVGGAPASVTSISASFQFPRQTLSRTSDDASIRVISDEEGLPIFEAGLELLDPSQAIEAMRDERFPWGHQASYQRALPWSIQEDASVEVYVSIFARPTEDWSIEAPPDPPERFFWKPRDDARIAVINLDFRLPTERSTSISLEPCLWASMRNWRPPLPCLPGPNTVTLYSDRDFAGRCVSVGTGRWDSDQLGEVGPEEAESMKVGANVSATVCTGREFTRCNWTIQENVVNLGEHPVGPNNIVAVIVQSRR